MFSDPTLYGATLPHRDVPFVNPLFAQWQQPLPWMYSRFIPPMFPPELMTQSQFNVPYVQPFYGNKLFPQVPYTPFPQNAYGWQGAYNWPQYRWQFPIG